jgi:hypothetical protein
MNDRGLVGNFVDWCERRGLDPAETVAVLHAQDWHDEEYVTIPPFAIYED